MLPAKIERRDLWRDPSEWLRREFGGFLSPTFGEPAPATELAGWYPVDAWEDNDAVFIDAELPGFSKDQVNVTLEKNTLTITAERKAEEKKAEKHIAERRVTRVRRSFMLPSSVDESKVEAKLSDGVLHLKLNKLPGSKAQKITIK